MNPRRTVRLHDGSGPPPRSRIRPNPTRRDSLSPLVFYAVGAINLTAPSISVDAATMAQEPAVNVPASPSPALSTEDSQRVADLESHIKLLRTEARYQEAAALASTILDIRVRSQGNDWWTTVEARRRLQCVRRVASLPPDAQKELATVDGAESLFQDLLVKGRYADTLPAMKRQLEIRRKHLTSDDPDLALSLDNLGGAYVMNGDPANGERCLRETLEIYRNAFGDKHPLVAKALGAVGLMRKRQGDYTQGEAHYREAIAIFESTVGEYDSDLATVIGNVGTILWERSDFAQAEVYIRRSLAIEMAVRGPESEDVATSRGRLAMLLLDKGEFTAAETEFREELRLRRKLLGDTHPLTAVVLKTFGGLYLHTGNYAAAEAMIREAVAIDRASLGPTHPELAVTLEYLGMALSDRGDYDAAEPLFREAVQITRRSQGARHPHLASSLSNFALLLFHKGDYAGAEATFEEALSIDRQAWGTDHRYVALDLHHLGMTASARGDHASAEKHLREALEISKRILGPEHPSTAGTMGNLAEALSLALKFDEADAVFRETLRLCEFLPPGSATTPSAQYRFAKMLIAKGDYASAVPLLQAALTAVEQQRSQVPGREGERALYSAAMNLPDITAFLAEALIKLSRTDEALAVLERGRSRALLDLLSRSERDLIAAVRDSGDLDSASLLDRAIATEAAARAAVQTAESELIAAQAKSESNDDPSQELQAKRRAAVAEARQTLHDADATVTIALRGVWPDAKPAAVAEIRAALHPQERMLVYNWSQSGITLLIVPPGEVGAVRSAVLVDGVESREDLEKTIRLATGIGEHLATGPSGPSDTVDLLARCRSLFDRLVPTAIRDELASATRIIVVPDGPLRGIPLEVLFVAASPNPADSSRRWSSESIPRMVYVDSGSLFVNRRRQREYQRSRPTDARRFAVVLGDPIFDHQRTPTPVPEGVLLMAVNADSNADTAGLRRGDVLLRYADAEVTTPDSLDAAIGTASNQVNEAQQPGDARVPVAYWRGGETKQATVAPGPLGVQLSLGTAAEGLRLLGSASRGADEKISEASALDQIRLFAGRLARLPGSRREAEAVAGIITSTGAEAALLLGDGARLAPLEQRVAGAHWLHLATHGLAGSKARPFDAGLALTQPETPSENDIGFLTLDHIIRQWRGKLTACELVVLSACNTQRGVPRGDSVMTLPWGFMYAGAPTVVAGLWKVDDAATTLLMERFYQNLTGSTVTPGETASMRPRLSKADALAEAKEWLRTQATQKSPMLADRGGVGTTRLAVTPSSVAPEYSHPYYWAGFILIGEPE